MSDKEPTEQPQLGDALAELRGEIEFAANALINRYPQFAGQLRCATQRAQRATRDPAQQPAPDAPALALVADRDAVARRVGEAFDRAVSAP